MKLKYVGTKEEETAFSRDTGITWYPGSSHEVPDAISSKMLQHPDVFERDESFTRPAKTVGTGGTLAPGGTVGNTADTVDTEPGDKPSWDALDKRGLYDLAKVNGIEIKWTVSEKAIRDALTEAGVK